MSGRKQHYIPQFLLRAFAKKRKADQFQVRAYFPGRSFVTATSGVAAEREFYSIISAEEETLDDRITTAEAEYSKLHRTLLESDVTVNAGAAARLLAHLTLRGAHTREAVSHMGRSAMEMMGPYVRDSEVFRREAGLDGPMPTGHFKQAIDKKYNELRQRAGKAFMSRYAFQRISHQHARERFEELWPETVRDTDWVAKRITAAMPETVAEAQKNVLTMNFEPTARVETYTNLHWSLDAFENTPLVLPDCIAIGVTKEGKLAPAFVIRHDEIADIYFPLSSGMLLHGYNEKGNQLSADEFNERAVQCSWDLYISHPHIDLTCFSQQIGQCIRSYLSSLLSKAFVTSRA